MSCDQSSVTNEDGRSDDAEHEANGKVHQAPPLVMASIAAFNPA